MRPRRSSVITPKTYRKSMLPSRCTQLPWMNRAVAGVRAAPGEPWKSSAGTTPQRWK